MNILASRLSTQVGIIVFICLIITTLSISWVFYKGSSEQLVYDANVLALEETEYLAMGIANLVLYQKIYPIWAQMNKVVKAHGKHDQLASPTAFAVTNENQQVLAHSDLAAYPLMSTITLDNESSSWDGDFIRVTQPVYHPTSSRIVGHLSITFDASSVTKRLAEIRSDLIFVTGITLLLSMLIAFGVRTRVAKPLKEIAAAAKTIGSGNTLIENISGKPLEIFECSLKISWPQTKVWLEKHMKLKNLLLYYIKLKS